MMPRDPQCDNDNCDYDDNGRWAHVPKCPAAQDAAFPEDMALATAREDGYPSPFIPRQQNRRAAA